MGCQHRPGSPGLAEKDAGRKVVSEQGLHRPRAPPQQSDATGCSSMRKTRRRHPLRIVNGAPEAVAGPATAVRFQLVIKTPGEGGRAPSMSATGKELRRFHSVLTPRMAAKGGRRRTEA